MKIGIISDSLNQSLAGVGNYTYNLIKNLNRLTRREQSIHIINYKKNKLFPNDKIIINNPFRVYKTYTWYLFLAMKLQEQKLDVIHNPSQVPTFLRFKQKYIITVHDLTPYITPKESKFGRPLLYKLLFPRTLKTADKIIVVSKSTREDLIHYFNISEEKITVVREAADEKFRPLNELELMGVKHKYELDFPTILYVGTLEARKNLPTLIKAFYNLKKKKIEHKLIIAGKKGWKYKNIFAMIHQLNLQSEVMFTGYVPTEDLPALYNVADLFVYPSLYEGFGLPPLEAMACGIPVITSNTSSLPEVVGDAGIMIDPYDVDGLADAMHNVLTNEGLREDMIKKGLERAKLFNWEICAKETIDVYTEVYSKT